ncbi:adhesion G protein-coupled receptor E1-like [Mercenaria mercenaria]|uniref:adhesion G protein-coupled receptor E1-like n=1 Tax=Mercenaria mercenaria TaxID=6596 RepID=UPI00234EEC23|nr:adhesion G protein-coupled receptor E1-like [Mercenaria mercenaria]
MCNSFSGGPTTPEFSYILNLNLFHKNQETHVSNLGGIDTRCLESEVMDPYLTKCRPLTCPFPTTPKYGTCMQPPFIFKDPILFLSFLIAIHEDVITFVSWRNTMNDEDIKLFLRLLNITSCVYAQYVTNNYISKLTGLLKYIHLKMHLPQTPLCGKSILENIFYDHAYSAKENLYLSIYGHRIHNYTVEPFIPFTYGNDSTYNFAPKIGSYNIKTFTTNSSSAYRYHYGSVEGLPCPYLFLNAGDFLSLSSTPKQYFRHFDWSTIVDRFVSRKYYSNGEGKYVYFICLECYMPSIILLSRKESDINKRIVTLAFAISSMVCIIVCIVVFSIKGNKRSFPSKVFQMALYNLFLAQGFFQFGVERTNLPYPCCIVIGMFVHYFWLTAVFSLNAFCVLVATKLSAFNDERRVKTSAMIKILFYIYLLPGLFVGANVIYSMLVKGKIGYGDKLCYIDEAVMRGLVFALPIFIIIFANCFVYFYIVYKTRAISIMAGRRSREMKYATVYFRLLLLTGVSWVFGFLNEIFSSDVLQYCFIVTIAGQGVFLFLAFCIGHIRSAFVRLTANVIRRTN